MKQLYRAWDKNQQIMRGVKGLFWTKNNLVAHCSPMGNNFDKFFTAILNDGEYHLMQSTGLFDKNGKEIFESDIVKTTRFFGRADESGGFYEYEKEFIGIVKQLEGAWVIDTEKGAVYLWSDIDENEVLGNIWENPKLLEEIKDE